LLLTQASMMMTPNDTTTVIFTSQAAHQLWLQLLPLIIAALAVFFGPLIQLYLGKRQIRAQLQIAHEQLRATVRSNNRQQWIHILRDQVSGFASELGGLLLTLDKHGKLRDPKAYPEKVEKLLFLQTKIQLLLNPDKPDHQEIIRLVDEAREAAVNREVARVEMTVRDITEKAQALFKGTWERIKKLE
jgi:hypothetical protein